LLIAHSRTYSPCPDTAGFHEREASAPEPRSDTVCPHQHPYDWVCGWPVCPGPMQLWCTPSLRQAV